MAEISNDTGVHSHASELYAVTHVGAGLWTVERIRDAKTVGVVHGTVGDVYAIKLDAEPDYRDITVTGWENALDTLIEEGA